jgi:hypothetical protein
MRVTILGFALHLSFIAFVLFIFPFTGIGI